MDTIIGRKEELSQLQNWDNSNRSEFIALYGRRRVGKTFLINQMYGGQFAFSMTGVLDGTFEDQMTAFEDAMNDYGYELKETPTTWMKAFVALKNALKKRIDSMDKCVIFIDELPAMDAENSGVAKALGYFWNKWAELEDKVRLIICGSATSWMITNVIDSKGGLHDRITQELPIHPFCLGEVEEYLISRGFQWNRLMMLQTYMIFGGIPYYLKLMNPAESLVQNVDRMFFSADSHMRREYKRLFSTLYKNPSGYMRIIETLAGSRRGMTRTEIAEVLQVPNNGHLGDKLDDLAECELIRRMAVREKKIKKTDAIYTLSDFFCIFYLTFVARAQVEQDYWSHHINTSEVNTWLGLAYERVCAAHIPQIKYALRVDGISTLHYSWRSKKVKDIHDRSAQIDIVIERADSIVNLCEVKYSSNLYTLDKEEFLKLENREKKFITETQIRHAPQLVLISTYGMNNSQYIKPGTRTLTMDELFNIL